MLENADQPEQNGNRNTALIVIAVIAFLLLCFCCFTLVLAWIYGDAVLEALDLARVGFPLAF